jgi:tripartite-type tricarboxylate transporter receptor subunit TctC
MMRRIACAALLALCGFAGNAWAQAYPSKPVRLVVGFAPGGAADTVARAIGDQLGRVLGQPIVIENRAGAGSSIAAENVAKSPPDGYSILIASPASISVNPALNAKLNYKPGDLAPVTKVSTSPLLIVVNPATGITSVKELVARAKKEPGKLNYATSGVGSAPHFGAALFSQVTGVEMVHVPFKGGAPAVVSVVAGDTQLTFATPPSVLGMVKGQRLRALAVTSPERSPLMPEVPRHGGSRRARVQHRVLVRHLRARRNAARDREEALRGDHARGAAAGSEGDAGARRHGSRAVEIAGGVRRVPRRGLALLGEAREGIRARRPTSPSFSTNARRRSIAASHCPEISSR